MTENLKIQLLIDVLKSQMDKLEDKQSLVYQTLDAVLDLANNIKKQTTFLK
jgi:hypothetical protein